MVTTSTISSESGVDKSRVDFRSGWVPVVRMYRRVSDESSLLRTYRYELTGKLDGTD